MDRSFIWSSIRHQAASNVIVDSDELYWMRSFRRKFSSYFHTPLVDVEKIDFSKVYLNVLEFEIEKLDDDQRLAFIEDLLKQDEGASAAEEAEIQAQIKRWEKEEKIKQAKRAATGPSFEDMAHAKKFKKKKTAPEMKPIEKTYDIEEDDD